MYICIVCVSCVSVRMIYIRAYAKKLYKSAAYTWSRESSPLPPPLIKYLRKEKHNDRKFSTHYKNYSPRSRRPPHKYKRKTRAPPPSLPRHTRTHIHTRTHAYDRHRIYIYLYRTQDIHPHVFFTHTHTRPCALART